MELVDYKAIFQQFPWIIAEGRNCILSPDSDGLLCGLLMSHYLDWKICGFYDGKALVVKRGINPRECVFIDMEIFRRGVKSIGQHMLMYNKEALPTSWNNFDDCISANNLRGFDYQHDFKLKYPLGTIHLLLGILGHVHTVGIPTSAICPLLYTDGTFKNQFNYPENCLGWLEYLGAHNPKNPLHKIFFNEHYSTARLMVALRDFFADLKLIGGGFRGADKIRISDSKGSTANIDHKTRKLSSSTVSMAVALLNMLASRTKWRFKRKNWCWGPYDILVFKKASGTIPSKGRFNAMVSKKPLSFAIISGLSIEFTLDTKNTF